MKGIGWETIKFYTIWGGFFMLPIGVLEFLQSLLLNN